MLRGTVTLPTLARNIQTHLRPILTSERKWATLNGSTSIRVPAPDAGRRDNRDAGTSSPATGRLRCAHEQSGCPASFARSSVRGGSGSGRGSACRRAGHHHRRRVRPRVRPCRPARSGDAQPNGRRRGTDHRDHRRRPEPLRAPQHRQQVLPAGGRARREESPVQVGARPCSAFSGAASWPAGSVAVGGCSPAAGCGVSETSSQPRTHTRGS